MLKSDKSDSETVCLKSFFNWFCSIKPLALQILPPCSTCWTMEYQPWSLLLLRLLLPHHTTPHHAMRGLPPLGPHINIWMIYRGHQTLSPAVPFCVASVCHARLSLSHDGHTCILRGPLKPISAVHFLSALVHHFDDTGPVTCRSTAGPLAFCRSVSLPPSMDVLQFYNSLTCTGFF